MSDVNPYRPSSVTDSPGSFSDGSLTGTNHLYTSAAGRTSFLTVLFAIIGVWCAIMIGLNLAAALADVDSWGDFQIGDMLYPSFWIVFSAVALLIVPVNLLTVVLYCMWLHRSNTNARALGAEGMKFTPGWSVGWFFIPIMNLFKPYQAVKELYRASDPERGPQDWQRSHVAGVLPVWWGLWIVSNFIDNIEARTAGSDDPEMLLLSCWIGVFGSALAIVLCLTAANVVRSIQARLHLKAVKLGVVKVPDDMLPDPMNATFS